MNLSEQAKEARRQYAKNWRAANRGKQKQYMLKYWEKIAEKQNRETKDTCANDSVQR